MSASHYVYQDPDLSSLFQGDVLQKTDDLISHLKRFHPYYGDHADYKYFMVLTQSCDLVRRDNRPPGAPYITIAAVRPLEEIVRREAEQHQDEWQKVTKVIGTKGADKLRMFLESLTDNNQDEYFYLHMDVGVGIQQNCCAVLRLSVALKAEHYDMCLAAKIAQIKEPFQAKLGHLIGSLFDRVGTTEWNANKPGEKVSKHVSGIMNRVLTTIDDNRIREGMGELTKANKLAGMSPEDIKSYIINTKIVPKKQRFQDQAISLLCDGLNPVDTIVGRVKAQVTNDPVMLENVDVLLTEAGIKTDHLQKLRENLLKKVMERVFANLSDKEFDPEKKKEAFQKLLRKLLDDPVIQKILQ